MKIVILGAGQVGASVAEGLVSEENDITMVDYDGQRLAQLQDRLDLRTVVGNAATPSVLRNAGVQQLVEEQPVNVKVVETQKGREAVSISLP